MFWPVTFPCNVPFTSPAEIFPDATTVVALSCVVVMLLLIVTLLLPEIVLPEIVRFPIEIPLGNADTP